MPSPLPPDDCSMTKRPYFLEWYHLHLKIPEGTCIAALSIGRYRLSHTCISFWGGPRHLNNKPRNRLYKLIDWYYVSRNLVCLRLTSVLATFFSPLFSGCLRNIHTVHVDVGVFDRFPGIILCCDILISFLKEICINFWWYRSNLEAAIVGCLSSSSSVTIGGWLSSLVENFFWMSR